MAFASELFEVLAGLVKAALAAFAKTLAAMLALTVVLTVTAGWYAAGGAAWTAALAAVLTLCLGAGLGVSLAAKRALWAGVREGVTRSRIASRVAEALFDRVAAVPGAAVAVERVPLADAEGRLRGAVTAWLGEAPRGPKGLVARGLATQIERLTLAHLRRGDHAGGVDLAALRREVAERADELLLDKLGGGTRLATLLMVGGAIAGAAALAIGCRALG